MSNPIPGLFGTSIQAQYPLTRVVTFDTKVTTFMNGSEQRFSSRPPLTHFVLNMKSLGITDRSNWLTFQTTVKGMFGQNLTLTLGATTWSDLTLMSDSVSFTQQNVSRQYNQSVSLRQVQNASWTPGSMPTVFPTLSSGAVAQLPFTDTTAFHTNVVEGVAGLRYGYQYYGAGLSNFPSGPLRAWKISFPVLTDADVATIENFFLSAQGRYGSFSFEDPSDSIVYDHVRLDTDELTINMIEPNHTQIELTLLQTNGS